MSAKNVNAVLKFLSKTEIVKNFQLVTKTLIL